jgi:hypothetical protein
MNDRKRARLKKIMNQFEELYELFDELWDEEDGAVDAYPENLRNTARFDDMQADLEMMSDAGRNLQLCEEALHTAKDRLDNALDDMDLCMNKGMFYTRNKNEEGDS